MAHNSSHIFCKSAAIKSVSEIKLRHQHTPALMSVSAVTGCRGRWSGRVGRGLVFRRVEEGGWEKRRENVHRKCTGETGVL